MTMPEGQQEVCRPERQVARASDAEWRTTHVPRVLQLQAVTDEADAVSQARRRRRKIYQAAASTVTSSPQEAARLLERRRREARERLAVREQVRHWERWRQWAWCRGSCSAACRNYALRMLC